MDNSKARERIKEIAKTSDSIRKKYRALKTGKMEDIALERHFKSIIETNCRKHHGLFQGSYHDYRNILFERRRGTKTKKNDQIV